MKEDYINFETAQLLKEKGFAEPCIGFYNPVNECFFEACIRKAWDYNIHGSINAPTLQMAMKWLREKYNIHIDVEVYYCEDGQMWLAKIQTIESTKTILLKTCVDNDTYEEAVESAIKYCLTNLI